MKKLQSEVALCPLDAAGQAEVHILFGRTAATADLVLQFLELLDNLREGCGCIGVATVHGSDEAVDGGCRVVDGIDDAGLSRAERLDLRLHRIKGGNHGVELVALE